MMWNRIGVLASVFCLTVTSATLCQEQQEARSVMQELADRAERAASRATALPDDAKAGEKHRAELAQELSASLGLPQREPMKAALLDQRQDDDLMIEQLAYHWSGPTFGLANVIRGPSQNQRRPAIVVVPDRFGRYSMPVYKKFVYQAARQGVLVLFVCDPHVGKRHAPEAGLYAVSSAAGTPDEGILAFDALRALDYLLTRPDVDPGRIGLVGLGQGVKAVLPAGVLESRFQWVVCAAGSQWLSARNYEELVGAMKRVPSLLGVDARAREGRKRQSLDLAVSGSGIMAWIEDQFQALPPSAVAPLPCATVEEPDFSLFDFMRRRFAAQAEAQATALATPAAWSTRREQLVGWLAQACRLSGTQPGPGKVTSTNKEDKLVVEALDLPVDAELNCPARLVRMESSGAKQAAVILSHDGRQCATSAEIDEAARRLAARGYWVLVPEHPSPNSQSPRLVEGEDLADFYALADLADLDPLAWRVAENLAAFRYLASRPDVDPTRIVAAGQGIGAIDACLAALVEPRIAGVVSIEATTVRDWAENVASDLHAFWHVMPYLPGMLAQGDLDAFYAALAPRPLVLAKLKEGWPKSGFQQVAGTAAAAYRLQGCPAALVVVSPREVLEDREKLMPEGVEKQLVAVARSILPPPPTPGSIGSPELVKSRATVDSASGIVWLVEIQGGVEQEFIDGGYRLATWSFFNDNHSGQAGACVTPLILKQEADAFKLVGVGKTRSNDGSGLQTFPFEVAQGSDAVSAGCFFGFYTGDPAGKPNAGAVEFDDDARDRMTILTLDGQLGDQKVVLDGLYRRQSSYPRTYSIQAISQRNP